MESAEWGRNEDQMEELARSMRHSRREQMKTYDRRKSSAKISSAVRNIATETATALGLSVGSSAEGAQEKKDDDEYSPQIGDVVALVEESSTEIEPKIMLGKVLRVYQKEEEVLLAHLRACGRGTYRLTVGKDAWKESTKSLVHPVDVIFDSKLGVYKLRTPVIEIHNDVMSKRN
jgi:hypothetical protein